MAIAAGEAARPHRSVPRAVKATFFRIVLFYILTILTIGLCINYQDPTLLNAASGTSTRTQFCIYDTHTTDQMRMVQLPLLPLYLSARDLVQQFMSSTLSSLRRSSRQRIHVSMQAHECCWLSHAKAMLLTSLDG